MCRFSISVPRASVALALPFVLAACGTIPELPAASEIARPEAVSAHRVFASGYSAWPEDQWWMAYNEAQLTSLMEEALAQVPDMAAAEARVRLAASYAQRAAAAGGASYSLEASATLEKQSYNNGFPKEFLPQGWKDHGNAAFGVGYDFDFWGKTRAELAAAVSDLAAAEVDREAARLAITTQLASAYVELASLYVEQDFRQAALDLRLSTLDLVSQRVGSGLDRRGNQRLAEANVASAEAELLGTNEAITLKKNELAALVGAGPDRAMEIARPDFGDVTPHIVPEEASTQLVGRRPDIVAARLRAEALSDRIDVAKAGFYPSIRVSALVGVQSLGLDQLINRDSIYGNAGPAISLPIFSQNTLESQYRGARAQYDEAVANYSRLVVAAYREVADVVTSQSMLGDRVAASDEAVEAAEDAYDIAQLRYKGGLSSFLDVITVEERLLQARAIRATLDSRSVQLDIALIRALGGGFVAAPETLLTNNMTEDANHG